jgi:diadenylate cyclase
MFERVSQVVQRLLEYRPWEVGVELAILWLFVYVVYRFVRGTRAAGALKGLVLLLIVGTLGVRVLGERFFPRLSVLYDNFLGFAAIALVVTFQPELRRALIRLGETPFFRASTPEVKPVIEAIAGACEFLSRNKFGAIVAIERSVGLREMIESGRLINADVSADLLTSIFWPNSPLHDMAVVISGKKLVAAGVQFPLAEPGDMPLQENLGTRHRAGVGLARVSDALVVIVSEETGAISLADGRELTRWLTPAALAQELTTRLGRTALPAPTATEVQERAEAAEVGLDTESQRRGPERRKQQVRLNKPATDVARRAGDDPGATNSHGSSGHGTGGNMAGGGGVA